MKIALQTLASAVFGLVALGLALFWPAGTFDYWQAWVFITVFIVCTIGPSSYLAVKNPAALRRRMQAGPAAETRVIQKIVISATFVASFALFVVSALDHRFGWSHVPSALAIAGNVVVGAALIFAQAVVIQNSFAGASIQVEDDQQLVSTGLYGLVRHPMYLGALVMMLATPVALGSYWGVLIAVAALPVLAVRIVDEERLLRTDLAGYDAYTDRVRYRLLPYVW
ncbi:hypothetical protein A5740_00080 [Mycobacterium sp. GA-1841]|uniref:methyltransferase family protein n=1 Tax=Mycobacterium sp. GA-1841 TaxID=1834154 RepID=UPI00096E4248|nr:isoprenylcysteine carboxylmethyltransferase family protein [Mycobacterium sp. GA-1841]OMC37764.1 hypothetical protein A5740_00080 [Mycobacterium sp. GA-1841]